MPATRLGRYELSGTIGSGATSVVHLARLAGTENSEGEAKLVAIKRLHAHLADDAKLRAILIDEARLMSRITHPNVVAVLDVGEDADEVYLVLEYARGATLAELLRAGRPEPALAIALLRDVLSGLHAAHHARGPDGTLLGLVHRDVTPRNVIATAEGVGKILDFGIAKARARISTTREGHVRGSLPYMAPEQLKDEPLSAQTDIYAAGVVLWEALTGQRLFEGENEAAIIKRILDHRIEPPSVHVPSLPRALDAVLLRALASDPNERYPTGLEMALALEMSLPPASAPAIATWVGEVLGSELDARDARARSVRPVPDVGEERKLAPPEPRRSRWPFVVALLVAAIVLGTLAFRGPDASSVTTTSTRAPPSPSISPSIPEEAPPPATTVVASEVPPPVAVRAAAAATTPARATSRPVPSPVPAAPSAKPEKCAPYWVDDAGHRRFNRECLE